jgi:putative intracellular protease/amidase
VRIDTGMLSLHVDATFDEVTEPDIILVPGGFGQNAHRSGSPLHEWLQRADQRSTWTTAACTGPSSSPRPAC